MHPRKHIPSMTALLAFETSARLGSFTRAGDELCLSQSAVSRQVQSLEEILGVELFERIGRHIVLTAIGQRYLMEVSTAITLVRNASMQAMSYGSSECSLHLAVLPTFGSKWLLPRLCDFYKQHPDIFVHLHTRVGAIDFANISFDAVICVGEGTWEGFSAYKLMDEELVPVVSAHTATLYQSAEDLRHALLLRLVSRPGLWLEWLKYQGVMPDSFRLGPHFELTAHLVQAVSAGIGIGLLPKFLIRDELENGTLQIPFESRYLTHCGYYLLIPPHKSENRAVTVFCQWLMQQADSTC
ncbi:LysR family transcriptional regulator [Pseudomonas sp. BW13M1]|uniref:LysR family transcriptional regulator n=2 Tax=Pseudomonas peradeniyensis TaxID=2745488 RepID=A0A923K0A7_9PSED|nr:LysR family transcriptional regulator [Pseudomonas peradeniyensis]